MRTLPPVPEGSPLWQTMLAIGKQDLEAARAWYWALTEEQQLAIQAEYDQNAAWLKEAERYLAEVKEEESNEQTT